MRTDAILATMATLFNTRDAIPFSNGIILCPGCAVPPPRACHSPANVLTLCLTRWPHLWPSRCCLAFGHPDRFTFRTPGGSPFFHRRTHLFDAIPASFQFRLINFLFFLFKVHDIQLGESFDDFRFRLQSRGHLAALQSTALFRKVIQRSNKDNQFIPNSLRNLRISMK